MPKNHSTTKSCKIPDTRKPYNRKTRNSNKEYQEIKCPMCLENPHNAVLLICSNHEKGCRPYVCDTLCQFNCLRQYIAKSAPDQLKCPLCRGDVSDKRVVNGSREYMDSELRSCEDENCEFIGTRDELNDHWWVKHSANNLTRLIEIGYAIPNKRRTRVKQDIDTDTTGISVSSDTPAGVLATRPMRRSPRMSTAGSLRTVNLQSENPPSILSFAR